MASSNSNYVSIKIPKELVDRMDIILKNRINGYRSRAEIASEGIRVILCGLNHNCIYGGGKIGEEGTG